MTEVAIAQENITTTPTAPSSFSILSGQKTPVQYAFEAYLRSPHTRRQYTGSLKAFFAYLELPGNNLEEQALAFLEKAATNKQWVEESIILFITLHKQKAENREISPGNCFMISNPSSITSSNKRGWLFLLTYCLTTLIL